MYKLVYNCSGKTVLKTKEESFAFACAEVLYKNRTGNHYKLRLYYNNKLIRDWSCSCYLGLNSKIPSFKP